jgi:hypothetical protein
MRVRTPYQQPDLSRENEQNRDETAMNLHHELSQLRSQDLRAQAAHQRLVAQARATRPHHTNKLTQTLYKLYDSVTTYRPTSERAVLS